MGKAVAALVAAMVLAVPAAAHAEDYPPASDHTVCQEWPYGTEVDPCSTPAANGWVVQRGQTLWRIAAVVYGDGRQWRKIAAANGIRSPRRVRAGMVLVLP